MGGKGSEFLCVRELVRYVMLKNNSYTLSTCCVQGSCRGALKERVRTEEFHDALRTSEIPAMYQVVLCRLGTIKCRGVQHTRLATQHELQVQCCGKKGEFGPWVYTVE